MKMPIFTITLLDFASQKGHNFLLHTHTHTQYG